MTRVIEKTVYKFDELSDEGKETARNWWRKCENQDFDTSFLYDDFENVGKLIGIEFDQRPVKLMGGGTRYEPTIWWSGLSSQGDGACFEGSYSYAKGAVKALTAETGGSEHKLISIAQRLADVQRRRFYRVEARVKHRGHYYHSHSTDIDVFDREDNYRNLGDDAETIAECLRDFMDWIYRSLEEEYKYRMSDASVDESIECNEYEFDENGRIV